MKNQFLVNAILMTVLTALTQTVAAHTNMNGGMFSESMMSQELSALPKHSRIQFNSDYKVNLSEDTEFTSACHIEPSTPTGGAVTHAGAVFFITEVNEVKEGHDEILVIIGNSKEGNMVMIHCDKGTTDPTARSIGSAMKGLKELLNIDLILEQSAR